MEGGRFCFEGGTRCGKGEGLHVFRVDNPEDLQISFDLASKGKLENKKRAASTGFASKFSRINVFSELSWSKKVLGKQRSPAPISEYSIPVHIIGSIFPTKGRLLPRSGGGGL